MSVEERISNSFYPQVIKEMAPPHINTPEWPFLRPTNPNLPSTPATSQVQVTPANPIPPRMDYTAGNPYGSYYQPILHNKPCNNGWPPIPALLLAWENKGPIWAAVNH